MEGLEPQINIGQTEKPALTAGTPASLPEARTVQPEAKTNIEFVNLNHTDLRLLAMPDELFDAIAVRMSMKGISADLIPTAL